MDLILLGVVILLTDESGNRSKIGVTVNETGYITAHLKNDRQCSEEELRKILTERDVDFKILLPDLSKVDKKILYTLPTRILIDYGIPKEEVVKNKIGTYTSMDLLSFTREEIEKWDLMNKTSLKMINLKNYTPEEIIQRKFLDRVTDLSIEGMIYCGFNLEQIKKNTSAKSYGYHVDKSVFKLLAKSREKILNIIENHSYWDIPEIDNIEHGDRDEFSKKVKMNLVLLLKPTESELSNESIVHHCIDKENGILSIIRSLSKIGRVVNASSLSKLLLGSVESRITNLSKLLQNKKYSDLSLDCLKIVLESKSELEFNYKELELIKSDVPTDIFDIIFKKAKKYVFNSDGWDRYRLKISHRDRYGGTILFDETIKNIEYFGLRKDLGLEGYESVFSRSLDDDEVTDLVTYIRKSGIEVDGENGFKFLESISKKGYVITVINMMISI